MKKKPSKLIIIVLVISMLFNIVFMLQLSKTNEKVLAYEKMLSTDDRINKNMEQELNILRKEIRELKEEN